MDLWAKGWGGPRDWRFWGEQSKGKLRQMSAAHEQGESGLSGGAQTPPQKKAPYVPGDILTSPSVPTETLWGSLGGFFAL